MIQTAKQTPTSGEVTDVNFGQQGKQATIAVSISKDGQGTYTLSLQELNPGVEASIGSKLEPDQIKELPKVNLNFITARSIEVVEHFLAGLKAKMLEEQNSFAQAC